MYDRISESLALEQEQLLIDLKETQARFVTENVTDHLELQQNRLMALEDIVMNSDGIFFIRLASFEIILIGYLTFFSLGSH